MISDGDAGAMPANTDAPSTTQAGGASIPPTVPDSEALTQALQDAGTGLPGPQPIVPPRKRGRPPGSKTRALNPDPPGTVTAIRPGIAAVPPVDVDWKAISAALVDTTTGACETFLGTDWHANEGERKNLIETTSAYLKSKGIVDIPPGWLLAIAIGGYALPRLMMESTQQKIAGLLGPKRA